MTITTEQVQGLTGKVYSQDSDKIGSVGEIYLDDVSGTPTWVTVKTGLFGTSESFVPLEGARADGNDLYVSYTQDKIKNAPRVDPDGSLSPVEEDELYDYYGQSTGDVQTGYVDNTTETTGTVTDTTSDRDAGVSGTGDRTDISDQTVGHDTSGPTTDDAMTRSEEHLNVGTATREAGRARLRKYVTTENVTETVPVRHEEVVVEREPITADNYDASQGGPAISEEEHEVVLHEEVPVVDKDVEAVERVRLGKETVTEEATVSEDVRKENIETIDADNTPRH